LADIDIRGLAADSRAVAPGWLFAALPGNKVDGRQFVDDAVARGAVAVLAPAGMSLKSYDRPVALVTDENPRRRLALIAARFHAPQPRHVAPVTGTNGKTSAVDFTRQLWTLGGRAAASLGTLGLIGPGSHIPGALTTPDPVALHRTLADLAKARVEYVAIEASSHGLDQYRLDGLVPAAAGFTNLTRDHLDYHGSMEAYRAAKMRLFAELLPEGAAAIANADSPEFAAIAAIAARRRQRLVGYGRAGRELKLIRQAPGPEGQALGLEVFGKRYQLDFPVAGAFQAMNLLCALGLVLSEEEKVDAVLDRVQHLRGVHGRIELVARRDNGAAVYVDYAHTPDALETVLAALRPHTKGRLAVVFGCGGDRDRGKRPQMGAIAARLADSVIVTDDNPRGEPPAAIRAEILAACPKAREIGDREAAIRAGAIGLRSGDILVIAGKGHETGQIAAGVTYPFDDSVVAKAAMRAADEGEAGR
jgi:UDP-N-acetylmuramoyl-L-alanyl-D-glutamate--2,6-diaminopimelate ligase